MYCMQGVRLGRRTRGAGKPTTSLRLSERQLQEIDDIVGRTGMRSRTQFIEQAISRYIEELAETKIVVVRAWTEAKATAAILKYLRGRRSTHVSDIVEALGMEPEQAFRVVDALMKEGNVDRAS